MRHLAAVSTFAIRTSQCTDQKCKRASTFATERKNYFLKSLPSKIFKTANTQAKQTESGTNKITVKVQNTAT